MLALVTGSEGFVGRALCAHLRDRGWDVLGADLRVPADRDDRMACDVADAPRVEALLDWAAAATHIFHLAGIAFVPAAAADPARSMLVNCGGTIHLGEALARRRSASRLLVIGSADVYGPPQALPLTEDHPLCPPHPYAIGKAAADHYTRWRAAHGVDALVARPFNHSGPGQADQFVLPDFASQIAAIRRGEREPRLCVGNLETSRDFLHVRDVVRAYEALALRGRAGEAYNICSGIGTRIDRLVRRLCELAGVEATLERDPTRYRREVVADIHGSAAKLTRDTGWEPTIALDDLLSELLDHYSLAASKRQ